MREPIDRRPCSTPHRRGTTSTSSTRTTASCTSSTSPTAAAWDFLKDNIPLLDCPDKEIEEIYYFRWWTFRKHIKQTPDGFIITEFLPKVGWAGKHNSINCAAGHHFREGRWLHDPKYLDDYSLFWFRKGGSARSYSFWAADSLWARFLVDRRRPPDRELASRPDRQLRGVGEGPPRPQRAVLADRRPRRHGGLDRRQTAIRATINSYMYGDALAIARIAERLGRRTSPSEFRAKAAEIKRLVAGEDFGTREAAFFKVLPRGEKRAVLRCPRAARLHALVLRSARRRQVRRLEAAHGPPGFLRSLRADDGRAAASEIRPLLQGHECQWNGPSWPFSTAVTLTAMANLLNDYQQDVVGRKDYFDLLTIYARSQHLRPRRRHGRALDRREPQPAHRRLDRPHAAEVLEQRHLGPGQGGEERGKDYNHSTYLRPGDQRPDRASARGPTKRSRSTRSSRQDAWDYFCLDQVRYHGRWLTILFDQSGDRYHRGHGLRIFADGRQIAACDRCSGSRPRFRPQAGAETAGRLGEVRGQPGAGRQVRHLLRHLGARRRATRYRMWLSWRPKQSVALVESRDGIHWSEPPQIVLGPKKETGWEDDINRPVRPQTRGRLPHVVHRPGQGPFVDRLRHQSRRRRPGSG